MTKLIKKFWELKHLLSICIVYTVLVTVAFLYPFKETRTINFIPIDKLIHVLIYLSLSFLWISYSNRVANYKKTVTIMIMLLCFFYGIIIEVIQELFIPLRKADLFDVSANMIGAILGALLFWSVKNRIKS
ncbi:MAG: VanZ family protein [bacterium]|jgi:VanZ family protein